MAADAGGIHGTMGGLEARMQIMEAIMSAIPPDLSEHWTAIIDMVKKIKKESEENKKETVEHKKELVQLNLVFGKTNEVNKEKI